MKRVKTCVLLVAIAVGFTACSDANPQQVVSDVSEQVISEVIQGNDMGTADDNSTIEPMSPDSSVLPEIEPQIGNPDNLHYEYDLDYVGLLVDNDPFENTWQIEILLGMVIWAL